MHNATSSYKPQLHGEAQRVLREICTVAPRWDEPMAAHCTLRAGGRAEALIDVSTAKELGTLMNYLNQNNISHRIIGRGSNILVAEEGLAGATIRLGGNFHSIRVQKSKTADDKQEYTILRVGAGCSMNRLLGYCIKKDLGGVEFLAGIPGSLGGGVYMNAGAHGRALSEFITGVEAVDKDGESYYLSVEKLDFSYRYSIFQEESKRDNVIVFVDLKLKTMPASDIRRTAREFLHQRTGKQPKAHGSAGSFFKNPADDSAGRLIEAAGLKGYCLGRAMVSPVHANFIINTGDASTREISQLMQEVQQRVLANSGVLLEPEVRFLS